MQVHFQFKTSISSFNFGIVLFFLIGLFYIPISYAQTPVTDIPATETPEQPTEIINPLTLNHLAIQTQTFAADVQRQINDYILPVTVGAHVLNTLQYQALNPVTKGHILFITGVGNSAQMQMYQALSEVFVDAGYNTMIATLPLGIPSPDSLARAGNYWAESLNGIMHAIDKSSPYSIVYASGTVAATLLSLYDTQRLPLPDALVVQDVFFAQHDENQTLPGLMAHFPNALLDLSQHRPNRWAQATIKARRQILYAQANRQKTHRQLHGMPITAKQRYLIYKEMSGWFKRLGWF